MNFFSRDLTFAKSIRITRLFRKSGREENRIACEMHTTTYICIKFYTRDFTR